MKQYTYNYVEGITDNYHSGGGLVIVTSDTPQAALDRHYAGQHMDSEFVIPLLPEPDHTYELVGTPEERVLIFPDSGCC